MDKNFVFEEGKDYYLEDGRIIMTERYHKKRGICCASGCRHCPFEPPHIKGNKNLKNHLKDKD
jgi:hypothetical protein